MQIQRSILPCVQHLRFSEAGADNCSLLQQRQTSVLRRVV
jgi:hypothetical protein